MSRSLTSFFIFFIALVSADIASGTELEAKYYGPEGDDSSGLLDNTERYERDLEVGFGGGIVGLIHGDLRFVPSRYFATGMSVGGFSADGIVDRALGTDDLNQLEAEGTVLGLEKDATLLSIGGYARLMPLGRAFFVEGSFAMWLVEANASGLMSSADIPGQQVEVDASARVRFPMLGAHIGWCVVSRPGFYFEFLVGANFTLEPKVGVRINNASDTSTIDETALEVAMVGASAAIKGEVEQRTTRFTNRNKVLPNAAIRVGWSFDFGQ